MPEQYSTGSHYHLAMEELMNAYKHNEPFALVIEKPAVGRSYLILHEGEDKTDRTNIVRLAQLEIQNCKV